MTATSSKCFPLDPLKFNPDVDDDIGFIYTILPQTVDFDNARTLCNGTEFVSGNLASFLNDVNLQRATVLFEKAGISLEDGAWIGLFDDQFENTTSTNSTDRFSWVDNVAFRNFGKESGEFPWASGQPDNGVDDLAAEDCVVTFFDSESETFLWKDVPCSESHAVLCKSTCEVAATDPRQIYIQFLIFLSPPVVLALVFFCVVTKSVRKRRDFIKDKLLDMEMDVNVNIVDEATQELLKDDKRLSGLRMSSELADAPRLTGDHTSRESTQMALEEVKNRLASARSGAAISPMTSSPPAPRVQFEQVDVEDQL